MRMPRGADLILSDLSGSERPVSNVKLVLLINMPLSEAALRKLTKDEVIALTLECQAKFDNTLSNINKQLNKLRNDFKIESELSVSKNVNSKLNERVVALERQCWGNSQYSIRECLEITGVPNSISNGDLDVAIDHSNIEDCH